MDLEEYFRKKLSYNLRLRLSWAMVFLNIILFLTILVSYLNSKYSLVLLLIMAILIVSVFLIKPNLKERTEEDFKIFLFSLKEGERKKKIRALDQIISDLDNLEGIKGFGFNKKIIGYLRDYINFIISPLIFSKNQEMIVDIETSLELIDNFSDSFQIYNALEELHATIIKYKDFKSLEVVYPSIKNKAYLKTFAEFINTLHEDRPKNWFIRVWLFLENKGLTKLILILIILGIALFIFKSLGLTEVSELIRLIRFT